MQPVGSTGNFSNVDGLNDLVQSKKKLESEVKDKVDKYFRSTGSQYFAYGFTSEREAGAATIRTSQVIGEKGLPPESVIRKINIIVNLLKVALYLPIIGQIISIAGLVLLNKFQKSAIDNSEATPEEKALMQKELSKHVSHLKGRLIVSALGLGAVYLVPDLIFSIIYPCREKKLENELKKIDHEIKKIDPEINAGIEEKKNNRQLKKYTREVEACLEPDDDYTKEDKKSDLEDVLKRINQAIQQEAPNGTTDYSTKLVELQTRVKQELANLNS